MNHRSVLCLLALLVPLLAPTTSAQPPAGGPPAGPQWSVGLGVIGSPEPYVGIDDVEYQAIPVVTFRSGRFAFEGIRLSYALVDAEPWEVKLLAQPRFFGYDAEDSPFLAGMEDREISAEGGVEFTWQPRATGVSLTLLHDLLDRHGGGEAQLALFHDLQVGRRLRLTPQVAAVWQSDDLLDYYFGVRQEEARPGRPAYRPGAQVSWQAGVQAFWLLPWGQEQRWTFFGLVQGERLAGDVERSPIVADDTAVTLLAALTYRF